MPTHDWLVAAVVALTPVVVNILVYFVQMYTAQIPAWVKQLVALGGSTLVTYLGSLVVSDPLMVALVGLATLGLHAIINELGKATGLKAKFFPKK